jgi:hypothetical protein
VEFERHILLLDTPQGTLQRLSLDLIGGGFDVHYSSELDEAQLLAAEMADAISVVILAMDGSAPSIPTVAKSLGVEPRQILPVGPRPSDAVVATLADQGIRWHLWGQPKDQEIRFVLSGVLFDNDPFEIRYHLRVPTDVPARLDMGGRKSETTIRDLCVGGACLVGGQIAAEGETGALAFEFEGRTVEVAVRTAWAAPTTGDGVAVGGVSFLEVDPEAGAAIDALRNSVIERHQIGRPD